LVTQGRSWRWRTVELAVYIQSLRDELVTAWLHGRQSPVGFEVGPVELELSINAERTAEVKGGVRFWVVDVGLGGNVTTQSGMLLARNV
jgi:hypothetical protein